MEETSEITPKENNKGVFSKKEGIQQLNVVAVFLLLLAVSGNYVGETLSCQTQKLLTNNMLVKHVVVVSMLYFTMTLTEEVKHPLITFAYAIGYWLLFLMATKTNLFFAGILFFILSGIYVLQNYIQFLKSKNRTKEMKTFQVLIPIGTGIFIGVLVVGFIYYAWVQWKDKEHAFDPFKLFFGVPTCQWKLAGTDDFVDLMQSVTRANVK
jgi:hypothetical protein